MSPSWCRVDEELEHEEGVAAGLLVDELRERLDLRFGRVDRLGDERADVGGGERLEDELGDGGAALLGLGEREPERVRGADLVVAVSAYQRGGARRRRRWRAARARGGWPGSAHCRSSRKRATGCSFRAQAATKRWSVASSRLWASAGGSSGTGGCGPRRRSSSGSMSASRPAVRAEGLAEALSPALDLLLARAEDLLHEPPERREGRGGRGRRA